MSKWPMVKLGEVCVCLDRFRKPVTASQRKHGSVPYYGANGQQGWINEAIFDDELVLVAEDGGHFLTPERGVAYKITGPAWVNNHAHVLKTKATIDTNYLHYSLCNYDFSRVISGSTRAKLNQKQLMESLIPLPPLEEQKRIAGILEASARQLEKVQTALDSLRQMRSSLIEEYCATSEVTVNLDSLASVAGGLSLSGKRAVNPIECEYLRVANIQRNRFLIDDVKTIRCTEKELDRCLVNDGDILMLEANANPYEVGRAAIAETFGRQFVFQNHLFRIRPVGISSIVLNALLESTFVRAQLLRVVKTTSGLNTMTINQARNLRVPQRAPAKNHRFNTQLELLSSQARNLEEKQNLLQELHQSLVARAFTGAL